MRSSVIPIVILATLVAAVAAQDRRCPRFRTRVIRRASNSARGITARVNIFRQLLGDPNNLNEPATFETGRREVNWDAPIVPFNMPGDFFNTMVTRGLVLETEDGEFVVSNSADPVDDAFNSIIPQGLANQFKRFSPDRLFSPLNNVKFTATFRGSGSMNKAAVSGFGAVFVDVDQSGMTYMDYFDCNGCLIRRVVVPPRNRGLSFAGLVVLKNGALDPVICSVRFGLGTISLTGFADTYQPNTFAADVVVLDDFIYGEPQPVGM